MRPSKKIIILQHRVPKNVESTELESPTGIKLKLRKFSTSQDSDNPNSNQQSKHPVIRVKKMIPANETEENDSKVIPKLIIRKRPFEKESEHGRFIYRKFNEEKPANIPDEQTQNDGTVLDYYQSFRNYVQTFWDYVQSFSDDKQQKKPNSSPNHETKARKINQQTDKCESESEFNFENSDAVMNLNGSNSDVVMNLNGSNSDVVMNWMGSSGMNSENDLNSQMNNNDIDLSQIEKVESVMNSNHQSEEEINLMNFGENEFHSSEISRVEDSNLDKNSVISYDSLNLSKSFTDDESEKIRQQQNDEMNEMIIKELIRNAIQGDENDKEEGKSMNQIGPEEKDSSEFVITPNDMKSADPQTSADLPNQSEEEQSYDITEEAAIEEKLIEESEKVIAGLQINE